MIRPIRRVFVIVAAVHGLFACGAGAKPPPATQPPAPAPAPGPASPNEAADKADRIRVHEPAPGAMVHSPLRVTGEARGTWYFEASFPVTLLDASGRVLAQRPAQAQGEWMTEDFVPFAVTLEFPAPGSSTGTLVLEKDNPSGLPEHADALRMPLRFAAVPSAAPRE